MAPVRRKDADDGGVLDTAIAGRSDLLVTNNIEDFVPGLRADIDADIIRADDTGKPDVLLVKHPTMRHGRVIASVFAVKSWLVDGSQPPPHILRRVRP